MGEGEAPEHEERLRDDHRLGDHPLTAERLSKVEALRESGADP
jgi:hypothetical protein